MKISTLIRIFIALGIITALPFGATAATPKKKTTVESLQREGPPREKALFRA